MEAALKQNKSINPGCKKVVLYGPESTGKSTLARALADHFKTVYVEEYARIYAEKLLEQNRPLRKDDVEQIAKGQMKLENEQLLNAKNVLICDTDLLETKVYSEFYYDGFCPESVKKYALENTYDLYFLTYIDIPWETDGIRDQPNSRLELFNHFEQALIDAEKPYVLIKGSLKDRLSDCIAQIEKLLNKKH